MNTKSFFAALILVSWIGTSAFSQVKIGYTNLELILAYMPETNTMDQTLATFQKKLGEKIKIKDDYVKMKYQEYLEGKESGRFSKDEQERREKELLQLDEEVQKLAQDSEYDLHAKRQELLEPILTKLQNAINAVAQENGYTHVLNQTTSAGVSTILYGPEEDDLTEKIMNKLGVQIPKE